MNPRYLHEWTLNSKARLAFLLVSSFYEQASFQPDFDR
jgi:hypothetical protein